MIGIIGAGGHAKVIADVFQSNMLDSSLIFFSHEVPQHAFYDKQKIVSDHPEQLYYWIQQGIQWHVAIGNPAIRKIKLQWLRERQACILSAIHPKSVISQKSNIGEGSSVMAGAVVNPFSQVGVGSIINTSSSIDHDCVLGDYVNIGPGSHLAGSVHIGEGSELGTGSIVLPNLHIGMHCTVGAGSVVTKSLPDRCVAYGVPARMIKRK